MVPQLYFSSFLYAIKITSKVVKIHKKSNNEGPTIDKIKKLYKRIIIQKETSPRRIFVVLIDISTISKSSI